MKTLVFNSNLTSELLVKSAIQGIKTLIVNMDIFTFGESTK
jgi:hypothetical protein